jgi:uncharacterized protein (UPF0548 family)
VLKPQAALSHRVLSYDRVGTTLSERDFEAGSNEGFRSDERIVRLGDGPLAWAAASSAVLRWGVKLRSGFTVERDVASADGSESVIAGDRFWLVAQLGPFQVKEPVQVVTVVDEEDRKGFAYGTLTGHPVSGEESFLVSRRADGSVWLRTRSLTRPSAGFWRVVYPFLLLAQRVYRRRYLRALVDPG